MPIKQETILELVTEYERTVRYYINLVYRLGQNIEAIENAQSPAAIKAAISNMQLTMSEVHIPPGSAHDYCRRYYNSNLNRNLRKRAYATFRRDNPQT